MTAKIIEAWVIKNKQTKQYYFGSKYDDNFNYIAKYTFNIFQAKVFRHKDEAEEEKGRLIYNKHLYLVKIKVEVEEVKDEN